MINPKVYRRAAEMIADELTLYACSAVSYASNDLPFEQETEHILFFRDCMDIEHSGQIWFGTTYSKTEQLSRSLALLFTEQIAKDEVWS